MTSVNGLENESVFLHKYIVFMNTSSGICLGTNQSLGDGLHRVQVVKIYKKVVLVLLGERMRPLSQMAVCSKFSVNK